MTYLGAAAKANNAASEARTASNYADDVGVQHLARAVALLAEAVKELAETHHRES